WIAMPIHKAASDLLAHRIDAVFTVRSLRDRILLDLFADAKLKHIPIRLIEVDQAEAIALKWPFLFSASIPKGTYGGNTATPLRPQITPAVTRVLVTRQDIDPEAIAELTRVLFEHRLDLTIRFALASAIRQPDDSKGLNVPLHAGAAMYYDRDQPNFIQENAEPLALLVTLVAMLLSGLYALRSGFIHKQKNRMDSYNYVLLDIAEKARNSDDAGEIRKMKDEMLTLLETTVRALDTDEVTEEGFQSFSLLWDSVRRVLNERLAEIEAKVRIQQ
ncbi:MAG: TAXI family TRAP transporter solute-binding subunit, partial [Rhizobiaceae bacterium]